MKAEEITRGVKNTAVIRGREEKRKAGRRSESSQGDRGNGKETGRGRSRFREKSPRTLMNY